MSNAIAGVLSLSGLIFIGWMFFMVGCVIVYMIKTMSIPNNLSVEERLSIKENYRLSMIVAPTKFFWFLIIMCWMLALFISIRD